MQPPFFGVLESQGTTFNERLASDLNVISSKCQSLRNPIPPSSLIECLRLGKYNKETGNTPRPILAKFNSPLHISIIAMGNSVSMICSNGNIHIKRDLGKTSQQFTTKRKKRAH